MAELLSARGLIKRYGSRTVVDVDYLGVEEGRSLAILGPNGAGKSTLCRMLALLEEPDEGELLVFGRRASMRDLEVRRRIAMVFQRPLLFQGRVRDNVAFGLVIRHARRRVIAERVEQTLTLLGIEHLSNADVRTLSGGELQRVALARAMVLQPDLLFLDEPTSNLDHHLRRRLREDLRRAAQELSITLIVVTHDLAEALELVSWLAVMRDGHIVQSGRADEVLDRPKDEFVATLTGMETVWSGTVTESLGGLCVVRTEAGVDAVVVSKARVGERVRFAIRPENVILERVNESRQHDGSARNVWPVMVERTTPAGPLVRVRLFLTDSKVTTDSKLPTAHDEASLVALITRPAAEELEVVPGARYLAAVKATSLIPLAGDEG